MLNHQGGKIIFLKKKRQKLGIGALSKYLVPFLMTIVTFNLPKI